jgi:hypothetical protein
VRGTREQQRERRATTLAEQRERQRLTGFGGGNADLGHAVAFELRELGYHPAIARYGGELCSVGGGWNFQGNRRIAALMKRSVRSAQRYRARLEADGLLRSFCLEPGDIVDGQRCPVSRPQVVRDLTSLRGLVAAREAQRPRPPQRQAPQRRNARQKRQAARAAALVTPPTAGPPASVEQLQDVAARAAEGWVGRAILEGLGLAPKRSAAPQRPPEQAPPRWRSEGPCSDDELDALDAELRERTEQLERGPPAPD